MLRILDKDTGQQIKEISIASTQRSRKDFFVCDSAHTVAKVDQEFFSRTDIQLMYDLPSGKTVSIIIDEENETQFIIELMRDGFTNILITDDMIKESKTKGPFILELS